jgi:hypothetical protein
MSSQRKIRFGSSDLKEAFDEIFTRISPNELFESVEFVVSPPKIVERVTVSDFIEYNPLKPNSSVDRPYCDFLSEFLDVLMEHEYCCMEDMDEEEIEDYKNEYPDEYPVSIYVNDKTTVRNKYAKDLSLCLLPKTIYVKNGLIYSKSSNFKYIKFVCKTDITIGYTYYLSNLAEQIFNYVFGGDRIWEERIDHHYSPVGKIRCSNQSAIVEYTFDS